MTPALHRAQLSLGPSGTLCSTLLSLQSLYMECGCHWSFFTFTELSHDTLPVCVGSAPRVCVEPGPWSIWKGSGETGGLSLMLPYHDCLAEDLPLVYGLLLF